MSIALNANTDGSSRGAAFEHNSKQEQPAQCKQASSCGWFDGGRAARIKGFPAGWLINQRPVCIHLSNPSSNPSRQFVNLLKRFSERVS